jgi:hypothetical protein
MVRIMYDRIRRGKDRLEVHGVHSGWVPHITAMWRNEPYNGHVINNALPDKAVTPVDKEPTGLYFDVAKELIENLTALRDSMRAMDMAREMGANTMEISELHTGNLHKYKAVDLYFYNSDEE